METEIEIEIEIERDSFELIGAQCEKAAARLLHDGRELAQSSPLYKVTIFR